MEDNIKILNNWTAVVGVDIRNHGVSISIHKENGDRFAVIGLFPEEAIEIANSLIKHAKNYSGEVRNGIGCKFIYKDGISLNDAISRDIGELGTKERNKFEQKVIKEIKDS